MAEGAPGKVRRIIAWSGLAALAGGFALAIRQGGFNTLATGLGVGGCALYLTIFLRRGQASLRHDLAAALYTALVAGTCGLLYILALRHDVQFDLTPTRQHTLTEGTLRFLAGLRQPVEVAVVDSNDRAYRVLLDRYTAATSMVHWRMVDPRKDPVYVAQFTDQAELETIWLKRGERKKKLAAKDLSEAALTNALVEVTREGKTKAYFLVGHGELEMMQNEGAKTRPPLAAFRDALVERAIEPAELNLIEKGFVPPDATLLILPGPARDIYSIEERQLEEWLVGGGKMLILFDLPRQGQKSEFPRLAGLLRRRGIDDQDCVVLDMEGKRMTGSVYNVPALWFNEKHPITEPLARSPGPISALPIVRSLARLAQGPPKLTITPLLGSSKDAWYAPWEGISSVAEGASGSPLGVQAIGWAVEGPKDQGKAPMRLAVFGTSDLAHNRFVEASQTAMDLMLNTSSWLAEQDDAIAVPSRKPAGTPLIVGDDALRMVLILITLAFPAAIFFGGVSYARLGRRG